MLDDTKEDKTIKLLETAVLLMEGASEEDVKLINSTPIKKTKPEEANPSEVDSGESAKPENIDNKKRDKFRFVQEGVCIEMNEILKLAEMRNLTMISRTRTNPRRRVRLRMTRKRVRLFFWLNRTKFFRKANSTIRPMSWRRNARKR